MTDTPTEHPSDVAPAVAELDTIVSLVEAARLHLPVERDLRRHQRRLGLRPARRRAQEQRQAGLVAGDGPGARRHRRARRRDPHASAGVGHVRPRRLVQRPAGRVPDRPQALPARRAARRRGPDARPTCRTRRIVERLGLRCPDDGGPLSAPRRFNLMFKTFMGPVEDDAGGHLPAPGDGPGLVRQLQERPAVVAQEAAVRDRPDRQVVPQRDQPGQLRLPDARVRADGDAVLRPAGGGGRRGVRGVAAASGAPGTSVRRHARASASARARPGRAGPLREEGGRRRVPLPVRLEGAGGRPQPRRLRPVAPHARRRARSSNTSTRRPTSTSSRGSSRRRRAPTGRRSRS